LARGISLHVGVNKVDPSHYGRELALNACESDAEAMRKIADSRGFESTMLLTKDATSANVIEGVERAARELSAEDSFFFTYAGHGAQVPDKNDEGEADKSDETWVLYDRQLVDDELYALWAGFEAGVRVFVLSDSCHSGSMLRRIDGVFDVVATADAAEAASPRYRAMPRDVMIATYRAHAELYDEIQKELPSAEQQDIGASVLLISGCQDDQLSLDGFANGLFTENLLSVWNDGAWTGAYKPFHEAILAKMPEKQQPNYMKVGAANDDFEQQTPLTIG
jgi:hypothetical protein